MILKMSLREWFDYTHRNLLLYSVNFWIETVFKKDQVDFSDLPSNTYCLESYEFFKFRMLVAEGKDCSEVRVNCHTICTTAERAL